MSLDDMIPRPLIGVHPFNDLPIDEEVWKTAHNHHHDHRRLHAAGAHRAGIVYGLEVLLRPNNQILVAPGIAVTSAGETVIVPKPRLYPYSELKQNYVVLMFRSYTDPAQKDWRETFGYELRVTLELPPEPFVELARFRRSAAEKSVTVAKNAFDPASDELNLLHRPLAFPHCYADMTVGELGYTPKSGGNGKPNRAGLYNLLREGSGRGFKLDFLGAVSPGSSLAGSRAPTLLYMAGADAFEMPATQVTWLSNFLQAGGTLLGECTEPGGAFAASFASLAASLNAVLRPIGAGDAVLSSHYLFPAVPPGAFAEGELSADSGAGVYFSTANYGGAWQGEITPAKGEPITAMRERVRQAQEFGLNLVALAARRERVRQLEKMEG